MTTTELIKILQDNEKGGISHKPRNISLCINGRYMPDPQILLSGTGDGICGPEIDLDIEGDWFEQIPSVTPQPKTGYISIDVNRLAKEVAEKALDEITYEGKTVREWVEIIVKQPPYEDCISREEGKKITSERERLNKTECCRRCKYFVPANPYCEADEEWICDNQLSDCYCFYVKATEGCVDFEEGKGT